MQRVDIHIWALADETKTAVEDGLADRRLAKTRPAFFAGGIPAAIQKYGSEASPGLLIVETIDPAEAIVTQLECLSELCQAETDLILLGPYNDVALYRELTRRGVHEYLPVPLDPRQLTEAVVGVCADTGAASQGRVISFIGASGGVGSSTVANNVAWQLGRIYDKEVTLVDLDFAFGTVGLDFNLESPQTSAQALAQAERLDGQMLERFLARYNSNLTLLTGPGDCQAPADIDSAALDPLVTTLRRSAAWVVLDLPHYWGGWVRHALDLSDEIVMTAVPTLASLRNAKSLAETLNAARKNDAPVRIVLNRLGSSAKTEIPLKDFTGTLGGKPAVTVPHDAVSFTRAASQGQTVAEGPKGERLAEPFRRLATMVSGRAEPTKRNGKSWAHLLRSSIAWSRPSAP